MRRKRFTCGKTLADMAREPPQNRPCPDEHPFRDGEIVWDKMAHIVNLSKELLRQDADFFAIGVAVLNSLGIGLSDGDGAEMTDP